MEKTRHLCGCVGTCAFPSDREPKLRDAPSKKKRRSIIPDIFIQKTAKNSQQVCKSDHFWIALCQLTWTTPNVYLSVSLVAWSHPCFTTKSLDQYVMDHHWMIFFRHKIYWLIRWFKKKFFFGVFLLCLMFILLIFRWPHLPNLPSSTKLKSASAVRQQPMVPITKVP